MAAARRRGKRVGRPAVLTPEKLDLARRLAAEGKARAIRPDALRRRCNAAAGAERDRIACRGANRLASRRSLLPRISLCLHTGRQQVLAYNFPTS
jgi:predicted kinase